MTNDPTNARMLRKKVQRIKRIDRGSLVLPSPDQIVYYPPCPPPPSASIPDSIHSISLSSVIASIVQIYGNPHRLRRALLLIGVMLLPLTLQAQREFNVWCLGDRITLDFNTPVPSVSASAMYSLEGTASIADPVSGKLLFYTNGEEIFRRDGNLMLNGGGIAGSYNSTQSALIVPDPAYRDIYYVVTSDAGSYDRPPNTGVRYSVVDMSLDGGAGGVTTKNVLLLSPASEKLAAVRDSSGCGYWVIAHGWDDDSFHAFHIDAGGFNSVAVVSHAGSVHRDAPGIRGGTGTIGQMKCSPNSRRLALATYSMRVLELFDVDPVTGIVSNSIALPTEGREYGVSFSPDNSKLYVTLTDTAFKLYQFDVSSGDSATIARSQTLLHGGRDSTWEYYGSLQLAPDGNIYMARVASRWLGAVTNPNAPGLACNYRHDGLDLGTGRQSLYGLPNIIDPFFEHGDLLCGYPRADFSMSDSVICSGGCVLFTDHSSDVATQWEWRFEGGSVVASNERDPGTVCFTTPGIYRITLVASNSNGSDSITRTIRVVAGASLHTHISRDYKVSPGDSVDVPIEIDDARDIVPGSAMDITLQYRRSMMRLLGYETAGTVSDGWLVTNVSIDAVAGTFRARLTPPPSVTVPNGGRLLLMRFGTWLDSLDTSSIDYDIAVDGSGCTGVRSDPGFIRLELCGLGNRLIESSGNLYSLDGAVPNPFTSSTEIRFQLGLDGPTRLEIVDIFGKRVALLLDRYMKPGAYTIPWNGTKEPSGLYFYRITSGTWSRTGRLIISN